MRNTTCFLSPLLDDLVVIEGIDTPECLRADLVQNKYRGRRRYGFTVFCTLFGEHERCDGHIMVEWVREEIFLWRGLLVWVAEKVLEGEGTQFEEVERDDLEKT
jgi:hypothetical protein